MRDRHRFMRDLKLDVGIASGRQIVSERTCVFTETVRNCKGTFELVLAGFWEIDCDPHCDPLCEMLVCTGLYITRTEVVEHPRSRCAADTDGFESTATLGTWDRLIND